MENILLWVKKTQLLQSILSSYLHEEQALISDNFDCLNLIFEKRRRYIELLQGLNLKLKCHSRQNAALHQQYIKSLICKIQKARAKVNELYQNTIDY